LMFEFGSDTPRLGKESRVVDVPDRELE